MKVLCSLFGLPVALIAHVMAHATIHGHRNRPQAVGARHHQVLVGDGGFVGAMTTDIWKHD